MSRHAHVGVWFDGKTKPTKPREEIQQKDSRITAAVAERLKNVHPVSRKKVRDTATYVSDNRQEYYIEHDGSLWRIRGYRGICLPEDLRGGWMSHVACEQALIGYLRRNSKLGREIYPESPYVKKVNDGPRTDD